MHHNKKASNESKITTNTESKTEKKEESNYDETTAKNELEKKRTSLAKQTKNS